MSARSAELTTVEPPGARAVDDAERWVDDARAGDASALEQLYRMYAPRVLRTVRALSRDDAEAEDVAHDTFLIAWERLDTYRSRPGATFASWLLTIAMNVVRQKLRRARRVQLVVPSDLDTERASDPGPGDAMGRRRLALLLAALPERDRDVLALRYAGSLTAAEVAEALDLSEANVRKICERRRRELLDAMGGP